MAVIKKRKKRGLQWTEPQREIATLARDGKGFQEIVDQGFTNSMTDKVLRGLKRGEHPPDWPGPITVTHHEPADSTETRPQQPKKQPPPSGSIEPADHIFKTRYRIDTDQPIAVGEIQVLPEDWRITQYGLFLILQTFYETKEEIGYDGSIGQFIVDVFRFYRRIMRYMELREVGPPLKEVTHGNGRGEEADTGGRVLAEGGAGVDAEAHGADS